jgi:hypothetical protein
VPDCAHLKRVILATAVGHPQIGRTGADRELPPIRPPAEALAAGAGDLVVVAGTQTVERKRRDAYSRLGWPEDALPQPGESVCPVLGGGRLIGLQPKPTASQWEAELRHGVRWSPVTLPDGIPAGTMEPTRRVER